MGVSNSKFIHKSNNHKKLQIIDFGSIIPLGLYNKNDEYDLNLVRELILSKKLSPFYKGLSNPLEYNDNEKILLENGQGDTTINIMNKDRKKKRSTIISSSSKKRKLDMNDHDDYILYLFNNETKLYNVLYSNSVECPICFLYYPANINFARCCDQPICTECFVQIKKGPAVYNASSSSSTSSSSHIQCPYCMTEDFGIIYHSPQATTAVIKEKKSYQVLSTTSGLSENQNSKRKSIESSHPDVVLIDHVRSQHNNDMTSNSNLLIRATSLQFWFQSRPNAISLERYLATIRLNDMSLEDIMVIESIRQSLIDKENSRQSMY